MAGVPPRVDLDAERQLQRAVLALHQEELLRSAHDCAEGGLACALAESAMGGRDGPYGVEVEINQDLSPVALFFGETQGRVVVSCAPGDVDRTLGIADQHRVPASVLGTVRAHRSTFSVVTPLGFIRVRSEEMAHRYRTAIPRIMEAGQTR